MAAPVLRLLDEQADFDALNTLFAQVWEMSYDIELVNSELLRALVHNDGYVCGAYDGNDLIGGSMGFWGRDDDGWLLHSHITGVRRDATGSGVGYAIKQHQRSWTLARGVHRVTWTFDPLIRRNAYFNLARLGAQACEYHEAFYGEMHDPINAGDESDRCVAVWNLSDEHIDATNSPRSVEPPTLQSAATILATSDDGSPVPDPAPIGAQPMLMAYIPSDIEAMRRTDPGLALQWRRAVRSSVGAAFDAGYRAVAMSKGGWYSLSRSDEASESGSNDPY